MIAKTKKTSNTNSLFCKSNTSLKLILSFILITLIAILYFNNFHSNLCSNDIAGWVQAIGSISAIAGSFCIANKQSQDNITSIIKSQELASKSKRKGILAVVGVAKMHADNINNAIPEEVPLNIYNVYDKTIINGIVEALSAAPLYEIDSPEAIGALLSLRDQFVFLGHQVDKYIAGPWNQKDMAKNLELLSDPEYKNTRDNTLIAQKQVLIRNAKDRIQYIYKQINIIETNLISE